MKTSILGKVAICCILLPILLVDARRSRLDDPMLKSLQAENQLLHAKSSALIKQIKAELVRNKDLHVQDKENVKDILILLQQNGLGVPLEVGLGQAVHTMLRKREQRHSRKSGVSARSSKSLERNDITGRQLSVFLETFSTPADPLVAVQDQVSSLADSPNKIVAGMTKAMKDSMKKDAVAQSSVNQENSAQSEALGGGASMAPLKEKLAQGELTPQEYSEQATEALQQKPGDRGLSCDSEFSACKTRIEEFLQICVKANRLSIVKAGTARYARRGRHTLRMEMEEDYHDKPNGQTGGAAEADALVKSVGAGDTTNEDSAGPGAGEESPLDPSPTSALQKQMAQDALSKMNTGMMGG